jgi:hypothetical protein
VLGRAAEAGVRTGRDRAARVLLLLAALGALFSFGRRRCHNGRGPRNTGGGELAHVRLPGLRGTLRAARFPASSLPWRMGVGDLPQDRRGRDGGGVCRGRVPRSCWRTSRNFADTSAESGSFGLQLPGHWHGGQVRVSGVGPPVLPPLGEKYPAGRYEIGGMVQYTNRGLGVIQPRIRFGCRPEITTFVFRTGTG